MGIKLTKKQERLLNFISSYIDENNISPSYREIASGLGLRSVASVAEHVDHLVALGALRRSPGARTLEIVDTSYPETTTLFRARLLTCTEEESIVLQKAAAILGLDLVVPDDPSDPITESPQLEDQSETNSQEESNE